MVAIVLGEAVLSSLPISMAHAPILGKSWRSTLIKVALPEARAIALKAFPGKITEDLEKEKEGKGKGGSGLRCSFDIKNGGVIHEVGATPSPASCWRTSPKAHKPIEKVLGVPLKSSRRRRK
jgi:hypothetical protein